MPKSQRNPLEPKLGGSSNLATHLGKRRHVLEEESASLDEGDPIPRAASGGGDSDGNSETYGNSEIYDDYGKDRTSDEDTDSEGEHPRAVAWQDDGEKIVSESESASDESKDGSETPTHSGAEGESGGRMRRLKKEMKNLPFGTLLKAKLEAEPSEEGDNSSTDDETGLPAADDVEEVHEKPSDWKLAVDRKNVPKRVTKTAPLVETSKKPVSRYRQVVEVKKMEVRDPRFSSMFGDFNAGKFAASYSFIGDIQKEEAQTLRQTIREGRKSLDNLFGRAREREERRLEDLKRALNRTETTIRRNQQEIKEREMLSKIKNEERDRRSQGKGEWHMKEGDKRKLLLEAKYAEMESQGGQRAVKKFLEKKQRSMSQQERRSRPYAKGEFYGPELSSSSNTIRQGFNPTHGRRGRSTMREGRSMPSPDASSKRRRVA